jgi:hypothetical protein
VESLPSTLFDDLLDSLGFAYLASLGITSELSPAVIFRKVLSRALSSREFPAILKI